MEEHIRPSGTVTFLFTDIEGSTKRWEHDPVAMQAAHARQEAILRLAIRYNGGYAYKMIGDAFQAAFSTALDAIRAAIDAQHALNEEPWPAEVGEVKVRMSVHTGVTEERGDDYVGPVLNRVARILSAGYGGQVLLSEATYALVCDLLSSFPSGIDIRDLGEHRLKDLTRPEHIYQLVIPGLASQFPPLKTLDARPNNLPRQTTALIGREKETEAVCALLRRPGVSLVTLIGPGGTGKTRLGLQAAADMVEDFTNGVWYVDLAPTVDTSLVIPTIAEVFGIKESAGQTIMQSLVSFLHDKQALLMLDNFEQVVMAASQVAELLVAAPQLKVIVTSRIPLRLRAEREFPVPPLGLPGPGRLPSLDRLMQYEAIRLFFERAQDIKPDFEITQANAAAVAEICTRLDGLPLAIELAAARVRTLPPQALLARLSSRLKVLTGGARDLPERQQTLRAAIEWSYDLLMEGERQLFRRMAVFQGGTTLEALEAICNYDGKLEVDVIEGVESLISKSLLQQRDPENQADEPRFRMLETIHEYAREKLEQSGESAEISEIFTRFYLALAEEAEPHLTGKEQERWLGALEAEHENLRAALRWTRANAAAADADASGLGLRLAGALWRFWRVRGYLTEGREQLAEALALTSAQPTAAVKAKALYGAGNLAAVQGDYKTASSLYEESLTTRRELGDKAGIAATLNSLGVVAHDRGDYNAACAYCEEALLIFRELGDKRGIALSLNSLGRAAHEQGDYEGARAYYEESLVLLRELGDKRSVALSLNNLGALAHERADYASQQKLYEESLGILRQLGDKRGIALSLNNLGVAAREQGNSAEARALFEESLSIRQELGDKWGIAHSLNNLGTIAHEQEDYTTERSLYAQSLTIFEALADRRGIAECLRGQARALACLSSERSEDRIPSHSSLERAAQLWGAEEALRQQLNAPLPHDEKSRYEQDVADARTTLGEEGFQQAWDEGRALRVEQAIALALEQL